MRNLWIQALVLAFAMGCGATAYAADRPASPAEAAADDWYYNSETPQPLTPRQMQQQKSQIVAAQRMSRLAAMRWYGMSNERPTATATPFSGVYSPAWQMPGGRPFAWYGASRPTYIIVR
jgi:hypothetical protein